MMRCLILLLLIGLGGAAWPAAAQPFPSRPISIVVPYPAGGVTDGLVERVRISRVNSWFRG